MVPFFGSLCRLDLTVIDYRIVSLYGSDETTARSRFNRRRLGGVSSVENSCTPIKLHVHYRQSGLHCGEQTDRTQYKVFRAQKIARLI